MTTQAILNILNPVHFPTVSEWIEIARVVIRERAKGIVELREDEIEPNDLCLKLMQSWEQLTRGRWQVQKQGNSLDEIRQRNIWLPTLLTKSMFVCEMEKPTDMYNNDQYYGAEMDAYSAAQREVIFEGFALTGDYATKGFLIFNFYGEKKERFEIVDDVRADAIIKLTNATIFDFIIEIDRFNRTASTKIEIKWTENFIKSLLQ